MKPYYDDGFVTIYHGDCREILPTLGRADAIVTDPPYGLGMLLHRPGPGKWSKLWEAGAPDWDRETPEIVASLPTLADDSIIWGGNYFPLPPARGWLVWDKIVRQFSSGHAELAWSTLDQPVRAFNFAHGQLASEGKLHPTQKPLALMQWCVGFLPVTARTIVDPFAGSGTTLRAAKNLGLCSVGIEAEESYCEIAARRCAQDVLFGDVAA